MNSDVQAVVDQLRETFRWLGPLLLASDWSEADVEEINALVREHRDAGNLAGLHACLAWMEMKRGELMGSRREAWLREQGRLASGLPTNAEVREENRVWCARRGKG